MTQDIKTTQWLLTQDHNDTGHKDIQDMEHKTQDIKKQHGYQHKTTMTQLGHEDIKNMKHWHKI